MKLFLLTLLLIATSVVKAQSVTQTTPVYQLRIYEIFEKNKDIFHERFRDHAMRIMKKYNFKILSIYESKSDKKTEFVYFLEWPDQNTMKKAWNGFKADKEWIDIKKQYTEKYGDVIGNIEDRVLNKADYSPQ
ncbi:NIPSNAP protein [Flavobacterium sp. 90]|uniref:NIPSNAP family protein n=1 Tax=unclassified Flavobacterium TaxID=196869 RepID=UPI000EB42175|nr:MULTISPECIES: NIPSNAP family protein [unclassified Flavobacterium]RKR11975.1 NIPSNAP protein [Flavobacterium sp. 81]TCK55747.1 NIPSNAP protein [Flavobacterium sp. 90]